MINRYVRNLVLWAILLAVVLYFFLPQLHPPKAREEITYSQFLTSAQAGRISGPHQRGPSQVDGQVQEGAAPRSGTGPVRFGQGSLRCPGP